MLPYFKAPYSIYLSRDFLLFLAQQALLTLNASLEKTEILDQVRLFSLLHFLRASFLSVKCCRMQMIQVLNNDDIKTFKSIVELLA